MRRGKGDDGSEPDPLREVELYNLRLDKGDGYFAGGSGLLAESANQRH
jgi:hypothetical protein